MIPAVNRQGSRAPVSQDETAAPESGHSGRLGKEGGYCFRDVLIKRRERRRLQAVARELLQENKSLACCGRAPRKKDLEAEWRGGQGVTVWAGERGAYFTGLHTCGSVWLCPVCSAKISEGRKVEVQTAIDNALFEGMGVSLVTLTFRHGLADPLKETLGKFSKALRRVKSGRAYVELMKYFGIHGEIRALEVTHGANGWHPHTHALMFSHAPLNGHRLTQYRRRLFALWFRACQAVGLPLPSYKHGVDVTGAKYAAEYVAKWGFASELAKPGSKTGRGGGRTPWELLVDAGAGDKRAAWLFREYAEHFHGKRQLFWSRGLKRRLSVEGEMTDQEILDLPEVENAARVAVIDPDTWQIVQRAGAHERVLLAAFEGKAALYGLLNHLRSTVPMWEGGPVLGPLEVFER